MSLKRERKKKGKGKQSESNMHGVMLILVKVTQRMYILAWEQNWINILIFKKWP